MRPNLRRLGCALFAALVAGGPTALSAHADPAQPRTKSRACSVAGRHAEVRAGADAPWSPLAEGSAAPRAGEIRAGGEPVRFCVADGTAVELGAGSAIALLGEARVRVEGAGTITAFQVRLREGELAIEGSGRAFRGPLRSPILVRGPGNAVALSAGTTVRARVIPGRGALVAAAYDGAALVSARGALRPLRAGHVIELREGELNARPRDLLRAPVWVADNGSPDAGPLALVAPGASGVLALRFAAVAGAGGYEAEVARDPAFEDIVAHVALGAAQTTLTSPPLPAGRYFARLSARSPDGVRGLPSAARALRVARVDLPKGGALIRGLVVLPPNRTFTWDDPSGLEISNGPAGFAPAPRELGLSGGDQPSTLLVRLAGQRSALPLTIAPLTMRAEIDLGPKTATWPSDPVQIAVRVVAPGGTTLDYEPSLRVTVNLDVVSVRWERRGSGYRATLPPRTDGGPWIVRVEAQDQRGKELGFGALEVIRSRPGRTAFGDRRR